MYLPQFSNHTIQLFVSDFSITTFLFFISITLISAIFIINNQLKKTNNNYLIKDGFNLEYIQKIKQFLLLSSIVIVLYPCWLFSFIFLLLYFLSEKIHSQITDNKLLFIYNSLLGAILIFLGSGYQIFQSEIRFNIDIILLSIPYILTIISIYLFKETYGNVDLNIKPLPDVASKLSISFAGFFLISFSLILSYLSRDPLASTILVSSIFFYLYALLRGLKKDFIRSVRYTVGIFIFFISTIYPLILLPVVIIFYLSKYYYWHRFDIHYPSFLVTQNTYCPSNIVVNSKNKR